MSQTRLLIAGAGYLGEALAHRLLAEGRTQIFMLRRSPIHLAGTNLIQADLLQTEGLSQLPEIDDVVYCAAADEMNEQSYQRIYQQGLANLQAALRSRGGFRRLVYVSSTSVYAEKNGAYVDEKSLDLSLGGPSRFLVEGERQLMAASEEYTILRMGGIYGPGRSYFLRRVRDGLERLYAAGGLYSNRIHRDDCVGMIMHGLTQSKTRQVYNGVDCEGADRNEVIRWMALQLGLDPSSLQSTDQLQDISHRGNKRVLSDKIRGDGYLFIYPSFREGYSALLGELEV